ncbi:MAG: tripartite tricarboxylate transporter substrate binding protein, partial [Burkholderiales bacterium]
MNRSIRRRTLAWLGLAAVALASPVKAQKFPEKPISLLVGFTPGGAADTV